MASFTLPDIITTIAQTNRPVEFVGSMIFWTRIGPGPDPDPNDKNLLDPHPNQTRPIEFLLGPDPLG